MEIEYDLESEASPITVVGRSLQAFAKEAEFTARRGVMADLYPYIVAASKRMSARAIARFLEEEHEVKVSAVTVAKAIRNPGKYWMFFFDTIEPHLRRLQDAHGFSLNSLLFDEDAFDAFCRHGEKPEHISAGDPEDLDQWLRDYSQAVGVVQEKWYSLDAELRREAKGYLEGQLEEFEKSVEEEEK